MSVADRARRFRRRQRRGIAVFRIEVEEFALTDALIESGLLGEWDAEDRASVEAAAARVLADFVSRFSATRYGTFLAKHDIDKP